MNTKHKSHILQRILAGITTIFAATQVAMAYDYSVSDTNGNTIYYNRVSKSEVEVTYLNKYRQTPSYYGVVEIPNKIMTENGIYDVTAIGDYAFFGCRDLFDVIIAESVTSIGRQAFAWCDAIIEFNIPASVYHIGLNAFEGCYSLQSINVAKGNTSYSSASGILYDSTNKVINAYAPGREGEYSVAEGTTKIGDNAFAASTFLNKITLPNSLVEIGDNAFYFCNELKEINIPASVEHIGMAAISDCISLEAINVDAGNKKYSSNNGMLFDRIGSLLIQSPGCNINITPLPEGVKEIGEQAFLRNITLNNLVIPTSTVKINAAAFVDCPRLTTIQLPQSIAEIGDLAFGMCPRLTGVYCQATDPQKIKLGTSIFAESINDSVALYVPKQAIDRYKESDQWSDFSIILPIDNLKAQEIEWIQHSDSLAIGQTYSLNAKSTSGLPVKYFLTPESQEYAYIEGNNLHVHDAGNIYVFAYQPGNDEYMPAEPKVQCLNVATGINDITADNNIKVYGGIGRIYIKGAEPNDIANIYDILGTQLYSGKERSIQVPSGAIYIVNINGHSHKVAVR